MSEKRRKQMDFSPYESAINIVRDALAALENIAAESQPFLRDLGSEEWPYGQVPSLGGYNPDPPSWTTAQAEAGEGPFPEDEKPAGKWRERTFDDEAGPSGRDSWLSQPVTPVNMVAPNPRDDLLAAAAGFMEQAGLDPTSDAVEQLVDAFLPCLALMCEREMDHSKPDGSTWKASGWRGVLYMTKHKMERTWHKAWDKGEPAQSEMLDLINYAGFYVRARNEPGLPWGKWGGPDD